MIYLEHSFDAGHRIVGHKGKCARLHGHTYRTEVIAHLECDEYPAPGFVVDFGDVKDLINEWDHRMLLWDKDPVDLEFGLDPEEEGIVRLPFNPTAEHMAFDLAHRICLEFDLTWVEVRLWETPKANAWARFQGGQ